MRYFIVVIVKAAMVLLAMSVQVSFANFDEGVFFTKPKYTSPSISPNGNYFVQVERNVNAYRLIVTDLDKSEIVYDSKLGRGYPSSLVWISNRRVMYQQNGELIAMNIDGTEHRKIFTNFPDYGDRYRGYLWHKENVRTWEILHTFPKKPDVILTQKYDSNAISHVYKNNIFTGEEELLVSGKKKKIKQWVVDQEGNIVAGIRRKKGKFDMYFLPPTPKVTGELEASQEKLSKSTISKKRTGRKKLPSLEKEPSFSSTGDGYLDSNFTILEGSYESGIIYVAEATTTDKYRLSKYSFVEDKIIEVVLEDPEYDIGGKFHAPRLHFYGPERKLVGVTYHRDSEYTKWLDSRFESVQESLDSTYSDSVNTILQWSDDLSKFLVYRHSSTSLGKFYIYYPEAQRIVLQSDEDSVFDAHILPRTEVVRYSSPDGVSHESYLTLPSGYDKKSPLPLVVMIHGGPWSRYLDEYDPEALFFASKGYAVLRTNFRGSVGFGKKYFQAGDKELGALMIDDIAVGAKWAIEKGYADAGRVYAIGSSYGGYAALMSAIRYPELYKAVVSFAAPLDLVAQIKHYKKKKHHFAYAVWNSIVGNEGSARTLLKESSPIHNLDKLKVPYLVFHGEDDSVVPAEQAEELKKMLETDKKSKNVYILRREGHGFKHTSNHLFYVNKALKLFGDAGSAN